MGRFQYEKALLDFNESIRYYPHEITYVHRGATHYNLGNYDKAIEDLTVAITLTIKTDNSSGILTRAYWLRADSYYLSGEYEKSILDYDEIIRLGPDSDFAAYLKPFRELALEKLTSTPTPTK